jgi:hypothetical protein
MWVTQILLTAITIAVVVRVARRAMALDRGARAALRHAMALREEMVLIQVDNETLRRECVWYEEATGTWMGRYAIVVSAPTAPAAYTALNAALPGLALRMSRERGPFVVIRH